MSGREQGEKTVRLTKASQKQKKTKQNDSQCASEGDSILEVDNQFNAKLDAMSAEIKKIRNEMGKVVKKDDFQELVVKTITEISQQLEKKIMDQVKEQIEAKFESLHDEIKSLRFDNEQLKNALERKVTRIAESNDITHQKIDENRSRVNDAIKLGNYNEQYSRKNNVKIMNVPEDRQETEDDLLEKVGTILGDKGVELRASQVLAIHRLPSKNGQIRPVIIKVTNNNVKTQIMRQRKSMKDSGHRIVDDVTRLNTVLINRLNEHELIESAWFFNGSVFGKTIQGKRLKFDIYDDVAQVIANQNSRSENA